MVDFKAMLAAKKAAAQKESPSEVATKEETKLQEASKQEPVKVKTPQLNTAPLSFAEKMRLKKNLEESTNKQEEKLESPKIDDQAALRTGKLVPELESHPVLPPPAEPAIDENVSPEIAQAYADIRSRIDSLEALDDGPPLESAMKELKAALMKNPNAVELMLDRDIGQMVIALRRITKEAIIEAATEKTGKKNGRKKNIILSVEDVEKAFEEL